MATKPTNLFDKMRKNILKKNEDTILDLTAPQVWASSANYVLNHILSGSFSKGYPAGRITQIFGDSGCLVPHEHIRVYQFKSPLVRIPVSSDATLRQLTEVEILKELTYWYPADTEYISSVRAQGDLDSFFTTHAKNNSYNTQISNVYDLWSTHNQEFMVDTPDGMQYVSRFIQKDERECFDLRTVNFHIECSGDHLIETDNGWVHTNKLVPGVQVLTRVGYEPVISNESLGTSIVYDMTVEHENHRYWGGAGISSHNSGKSYLMARAIAEAQKNGYMVAVLDSEQAVSQDYLAKIGVDLDPSMLMTVQVQTVEQTQDMLIEILVGLKEEQQKLGGTDKLKMMIILDSLGMLSSNKQVANAESGHHAADMGTRAKAITNMLNQIVQKVGATDAVFLLTNHSFSEVGVMYPQVKPKGGQCLTAGTSVLTSKGYTNVEYIKVGDHVKTHMGRFKRVLKLFNFDDLDVLDVELENGQHIKMTPHHKMLVERHGTKMWLEAQDLTTEDSLLELVDVD